MDDTQNQNQGMPQTPPAAPTGDMGGGMPAPTPGTDMPATPPTAPTETPAGGSEPAPMPTPGTGMPGGEPTTNGGTGTM